MQGLRKPAIRQHPQRFLFNALTPAAQYARFAGIYQACQPALKHSIYTATHLHAPARLSEGLGKLFPKGSRVLRMARRLVKPDQLLRAVSESRW